LSNIRGLATRTVQHGVRGLSEVHKLRQLDQGMSGQISRRDWSHGLKSELVAYRLGGLLGIDRE